MAVSDLFVLFSKIIISVSWGRKKIVISLSLAVEDERAWIERSVFCSC